MLLKYRPEIDGLRTLAVIPVILFHLNYEWINGGYYGVDVFFVISGFLITGILKEQIESNTFSMWSFWIRRIKRLLPVLLTVIITTIAFTHLLLFKPVLLNITKQSIPAIFSYFNFYAGKNLGNYWGGAAENSFFLHTWSLSIEEQFYLIYPIFLLISFKVFNKLKFPILIITIVSFILFIFGTYYKPVFTFYMLPTRLWELSIGGIIALLNRKEVLENIKLSNYASVFGLLLICLSYFIDSGKLSLMATLPIIGTSLLLYYCTTTTWVGKILSMKPLVIIGKLSYSLYLWHWPVFVFFKNNYYLSNQLSTNSFNLLAIILTIILAVISYYLVENTLRNYKYTPIIVLAGVISIITYSYTFRSNIKYIQYPEEFTNKDYFIYKYDIAPRPLIITNKALLLKKTLPKRNEKYKNAYKEEGIITRINNNCPKIILLGDSHALMWAEMIVNISDKLKVSNSIFAIDGVSNVVDIKHKSPYFNTEQITNEEFEEYTKTLVRSIQKWKPSVLVIAYRWDVLNKNDFKKLEYIIDLCKSINTQVLLLSQPPMLSKTGFDDFNANEYFSYLGFKGDNENNYLYIRENTKVNHSFSNLLELKKKHNNVNIYNVSQKMTKNGKILISQNINSIYFDDDHLSYEGSLLHYDEIKKLY